MPVARLRRRLVAAVLVLGVVAGIGLLVSSTAGSEHHEQRAAVTATEAVADHALPAARRDERPARIALTLAVLAAVALLAAQATPRPTPIPVPVVDDARRRHAGTGRQPRRRGPPPRA